MNISPFQCPEEELLKYDDELIFNVRMWVCSTISD